MTIQFSVRISVLCFLTFLTTTVFASTLIVPGKSLGQWTIGSKMPEIKGHAAKDKTLTPHWIDWIASSPKRPGKATWMDAFVIPNHKTKVLQLRVLRSSDASFRTSNGLSVKSSAAQIMRSFPTLKLAATYRNAHLKRNIGIYDSFGKGISFELVLDPRTKKPTRCLVINVHDKNLRITDALRHYPGLKNELQIRK